MRIWVRLRKNGELIGAYPDREDAYQKSMKYGDLDEVIATGTFAMDRMMPVWDAEENEEEYPDGYWG